MPRRGSMLLVALSTACTSESIVDHDVALEGTSWEGAATAVGEPGEGSDSDPARVSLSAGEDSGDGQRDGDGSTSSAPDSDPATDSGPAVDPPDDEPLFFVDVTAQAGLDAEPGGLTLPPFCILNDLSSPDESGDYCIPERFLGAAAAGDFDDDGWVDVYIARRGSPNLLMHNEGDGTFVDVAASAGLSFTHGVGAAAWADIDNDGDLDLMLTGVGTLQHFLMINDGTGHFSEQAQSRGFALATDDVHVGMGLAVGDFDLDGWIDVFVAEWRPFAKLGAADHNRLLRGVGPSAPGHFQDVTDTTPLDLPRLASVVDAKPGVYGFAPAFADLDDDGWPELTVTGDFGTSRLLWNEHGHFVDTTWDSGVGTERNGMGSTFADFDGDGDIDWFVSAIWTDDAPGLGHRLYENQGDRTFVDVAPEHALQQAGWGWGAAWLDYDNDGTRDLAMAAGWSGLGYDADPMCLWDNLGEGPWPDRATELGTTVIGDGRGLVPLDYDNDGDLDLLVVGNADAPHLFRNDGATGDWLVVRAVGSTSNRQGIGARVQVWSDVDADSTPAVAFIRGDTQLMGQPMAEARFGLGAATDALQHVRVSFPASGVVRELTVEANQTIVVAE